MYRLEILKPEVQEFIVNNTSIEISKLALQKNPFPEIDFKIILNQIEARSKSKDKLYTWFNCKNIIYPSKISIEQTSSETTAQYKAELISGENLIDLSGGFGVDAFYFSKKVNQVLHCEINADLSKIVSHNFQALKCENIKCIAGDSLKILENWKQKFDWIYIDPSRRDESKKKVFLLEDCIPNVPQLQDFYYSFSNNILIKTAPILDISAGLLQLKNVKTIHIVAVENEVKELLWEIENKFEGIVTIKTINFNKLKRDFFQFKLNSTSTSSFSELQKYLYEPNSAIMKSGGFVPIGSHFALHKLHQNSHLYTSEELVNFPGRIFEIEKIIPFSKKEVTAFFQDKKANITIRNFPDTVENIRKKFKIKEGGSMYCFFTTDKNDNKIVLICNQIKF